MANNVLEYDLGLGLYRNDLIFKLQILICHATIPRINKTSVNCIIQIKPVLYNRVFSMVIEF